MMKRNVCVVVCLLVMLGFVTVFLPACGGGGGKSSSQWTGPQNSTGTTQGTSSNDAAKLSGTIVIEGGAGRTAGRNFASKITPGHVTNPIAAPDIQVILTPDSGSAITVTTGVDGGFSIEPDKLNPEIYHVQIQGNGLNCDFFIDLKKGYEFLTEFTSNDSCYTQIVRSADSEDWKRDIEPDGSYVITSGAEIIEQHDTGGLTGVFNSDGTEQWYLDDNVNLIDDSKEEYPPALTPERDSDGDGCHDMRDFKDNDNDNDRAINFNDMDFNTNLLAASARGIDPDDCISNVPFYSVELEALPDHGDAPLTVSASAHIRGDVSVVDKYVWNTGKPGVAPIETTSPQLSITYDQYGTFILTIEVKLKAGNSIFDTLPIVVAKENYTGGLVLLDELSASCKNTPGCHTIDVDVDQYGNLFVLYDDFSEGDRNGVDVFVPGESDISDTLVLDINKDNFPVIFNMALDKNGYIYTLDDKYPVSIYIHNRLGQLVKTIDLSGIFSGSVSTLDMKGISVDASGNVYFLYCPLFGSTITVYKCSQEMGYVCDKHTIISVDGKSADLLTTDLEIDSHGNVAVIAASQIQYFNSQGNLVKTVNLGSSEYMNLALGPNDEIFVSITDTGGQINAYSASGNYLYSLSANTQGAVWDMYVDPIGRLYVATYGRGTVLVYGPEYLQNPSAPRIAASDTSKNGGFNVRHVTAVNLEF